MFEVDKKSGRSENVALTSAERLAASVVCILIDSRSVSQEETKMIPICT